MRIKQTDNGIIIIPETDFEIDALKDTFPVGIRHNAYVQDENLSYLVIERVKENRHEDM